MKGLLISTLAIIAIAAPLEAGPLQTDRVDADAKWLVHVDIEGLTTSQLGSYLLEHRRDFDIDVDLDDFESETGIDPTADMHDVTIYGGEDPEDDAVIIARMTDAVDRLVAMLAEHADDYKRIETNGHLLHSWIDEGDRKYGHMRAGETEDERVVLLAGNKATLLRGIAVLEGDRGHLTTAPGTSQPLEPEAGAFIYAAASGMPWLETDDEDDPAAAIISRSDHLSIQVGEQAEHAFAHLSVSAKSANDARNITDVMQGLLALGRLMADRSPEFEHFGRLADSFTIDASGNDIQVRMRQETDQIIGSLKAISECK
jgi:hypothetical protein